MTPRDRRIEDIKGQFADHVGISFDEALNGPSAQQPLPNRDMRKCQCCEQEFLTIYQEIKVCRSCLTEALGNTMQNMKLLELEDLGGKDLADFAGDILSCQRMWKG